MENCVQKSAFQHLRLRMSHLSRLIILPGSGPWQCSVHFQTSPKGPPPSLPPATLPCILPKASNSRTSELRRLPCKPLQLLSDICGSDTHGRILNALLLYPPSRRLSPTPQLGVWLLNLMFSAK